MDAITRRLMQRTREEEPEDIRDYIREMFYRYEAGLPSVDPRVHFQAPPGWEAPQEVQQVHDVLSGEDE